MLTTFDLDEYVYEAMRAGASGFLLKTAPPSQLAGAVRAVVAGDSLLAPEITRRLLESFVRRPPPGSGTPHELEGLTKRELEVLKLVASGLSNREIAQQLYVSDATVKTRVARVFTKLNVRDRARAVPRPPRAPVLLPSSSPCASVQAECGGRSDRRIRSPISQRGELAVLPDLTLVGLSTTSTSWPRTA